MKLSVESYLNRQNAVFMQFVLAHKALECFKNTPEAINLFARDNLNTIQESMDQHFWETGSYPKKSWLYDEAEVANYLNDVLESVPEQLKDVKNRMNQNQLILELSIFESFMKDIHRHILHSTPSLLNPKRQAPIGRIISLGLDSVLEEEIARDVHSLDRKSIAERCEYFKDHLSVDWSFDGKVIPVIEPLIDIRNKILHENHDLVLDTIFLSTCFIVCTAIPTVAIVQAYIQYPDFFEAPEYSEKMIEHCRQELEKKS